METQLIYWMLQTMSKMKTINKNAFVKAEIMEFDVIRIDEEDDFMADIISRFGSLSIQVEESELQEFEHIDDENNEVYSQAILEDVDELLQTLQIET